MSILKEVFYNNAKAPLAKPAKRVWFRLNPLLEKTSLFVSKKQDNSHFTLPLQSVVLCEKLLDEEFVHQTTYTEVDFWDFLRSGNCGDWNIVRVFEGQLFDSLLEGLHALEDAKAVVSHDTSVYTQNTRQTKRPMKSSKEKLEVNETLKLTFTYYGRRMERKGSLLDNLLGCSAVVSDADLEESLSEDDLENSSADNVQLKHSNEDTNASPLNSDSSKSTGYDIDPFSPRYARQVVECGSEYSENGTSERTSTGDRSPYLPNIYAIPHFRVSRPTGSRADEGSDLTRRDLDSVLEKFGPLEEEDLGLWLSNTMETMSKFSGRTVDRLRQRLNELLEERKRRANTRKTNAKKYLDEIGELVNSYEKHTVVLPALHGCQKVPTFRQYVVQLIQDRSYDPRFRNNKRRIQKFSKRYNLQNDKQDSEMALGDLEDQDEWKPAKPMPPKNVKKKKAKSNVSKGKTLKSSSKTKVINTNCPPTEALEPVDKSVVGVGGGTVEKLQKLDFVETVVGITDCTAFRAKLAGICEVEDEPNTPLDTEINAAQGRDSSGKSTTKNGTRRDSLGQSLFEGQAADSWHAMKNAREPNEYKNSNIAMSPASDSTEGGLAGNYRPNSKRYTGESSMQTYGTETYSSRSPRSLKGTRDIIRGPNQTNRTLAYSCRDNTDKDFSDFDDIPEKSPTCGLLETPELFDPRKLNRKYSFEKMRARKRDNARPNVNEILKKFMKIQKVAAVFRQGALLKKPRKGKQRSKKFVNPLQMTPSPEPPVRFFGKVASRRGGIVPLDIIIPSFSYPRPADFRANLLQSLDDFVVRKEHVISSYKNRSLTTITFSKPGLFTNLQMEEEKTLLIA